MNTDSYLFENECRAIIGAAFEVHNELGHGFLENVYQEALMIEFQEKGIDYLKEKKLLIRYKGHLLDKYYVADFLCFEKIIIEIKACESIKSEHVGQVLNYLKATQLQLALILNFGAKSVQIKRIVH